MPTQGTFAVHMETTVPDLRSARALIWSILEERLAASAWLSKIDSFDAQEPRTSSPRRFVAFKTVPEGRRRLQARILQLHPEPEPYLGWIRLHEAAPGYLHWVRRRTGLRVDGAGGTKSRRVKAPAR